MMLSVSSQLDTFIVEVQAGSTLNVNAFEFRHARGPSGLARHAKDLICVPASQAFVERIFSLWAALFWTTKRCVEISRDENLSKTQSESAQRNLLSTVTVGVNVINLCRNSLAEQN